MQSLPSLTATRKADLLHFPRHLREPHVTGHRWTVRLSAAVRHTAVGACRENSRTLEQAEKPSPEKPRKHTCPTISSALPALQKKKKQRGGRSR